MHRAREWEQGFSVFRAAALLAAALLLLVAGSATAAPPPKLPQYAGSGEHSGYLVGFLPGTAASQAKAIATQSGVVPGRWLASLRVLEVHAPPGAEIAPAALQALQHQPRVRYVEPNYLVQALDVPNDTYYSSQQWAPQKIGAEAAWSITHGSADIEVAVLDTGLDMSHPEMSGKYCAGYDFVNDDNDPSDDHGHGTHVSGIVGALTNNGAGIAAVGWATTIMPVKVLNANGTGTHADVAAGLEWATNAGAAIVNLSLGGPSGSQTLEDAVNYAYNNGVLVVAAAGNAGTSTPYYPAAYSNVIAVVATTSTDSRWGLSNYGSWIDMAAPGSSIYSTDWTGGAGAYTSRSGTSQASPHVCAVAALMLAVDDELTNDALRQALESTAVDLGDPGFDIYFGHGRLDACAAVSSALPATPTPTVTATPAPSPTPTPLPAMHIGDLDGTATKVGRDWKATVVIAVHSASHGTLSNAVVSGAWSGGYSGSASCTTGSVGTCSDTTPKIGSSQPSVTFSVTGITRGGYTYDSSANHDPDGDSNGTTITVNRP